MARPIPPARFATLVGTATTLFIRNGYRQTQMADVAAALGVAKGTLYGYVESKDALFDAAVRFADRPDEAPSPGALPVPTPAAGATVAYVRARIAAEASELVLAGVATDPHAYANADQELRAVLGDLYDRMARNRHVIKLVDRCAVDHPQLAEAWFGAGRWAQHELLVALIERHNADGSYCPLGPPTVVARTWLESIAFWAVHRHFDAAPQDVEPQQARDTLIGLLARGVLREVP